MTDMGTVEYLLKLYSQYFTLRWNNCNLEGYQNECCDECYRGITDIIEYILKNRFGMNIAITVNTKGPEFNTYRAYNSVCSISVGGCSQHDEN